MTGGGSREARPPASAGAHHYRVDSAVLRLERVYGGPLHSRPDAAGRIQAQPTADRAPSAARLRPTPSNAERAALHPVHSSLGRLGMHGEAPALCRRPTEPTPPLRAERAFALRCGSVYAPIPLRSAEVPTDLRRSERERERKWRARERESCGGHADPSLGRRGTAAGCGFKVTGKRAAAAPAAGGGEESPKIMMAPAPVSPQCGGRRRDASAVAAVAC